MNASGKLRKFGYDVETDFNPTKRRSRKNRIHNEPINTNFKRYLDVYGVKIPYLSNGIACHDYATNQYTKNFHNNIRYHAYKRVRDFFNLHKKPEIKA